MEYVHFPLLINLHLLTLFTWDRLVEVLLWRKLSYAGGE